MFFRKKVVVDLLLDERIFLGKFSRICPYRLQMHQEQAHRQTFFYICIDRQVGETLSEGRRPRLDLPLDLGECHRKFGDASYYRD
jgi:hypothetical protein